MMDSWSDRDATDVQVGSGIRTDLYEASTHPFIVKIWLEETEEEAGRAVWRGHITHVLSGERRYFQALDDITAFIIPYLNQMGVKLCTWQRLRRRVRCAKLFLKA